MTTVGDSCHQVSLSGADRCHQRTITIVGAGYSGTLTAANILRRNLGTQVRVILVERNTRPGRGLAYRTWDDNLLLNVPAGNMSAFTEDPHHFVQFCQNIDPAFNAGTFVSRRLYGDYLESILAQETERNSETSLEKICCGAIAVGQQSGDSTYQVDLADGRSIHSDQVVLAFGHFAPQDPPQIAKIYKTGIYISNPWDSIALERIQGDIPVALLGTGLTALDVLFRLTSNSDTRKIYLVSRRGLFPQPHRSHPKVPVVAGFPSFLENLPPTVRAYFHALRFEIKKKAPQELIGETLSMRYDPILLKYGGVFQWKNGRNSFLALHPIGISTAIVLPQRHTYAWAVCSNPGRWKQSRGYIQDYKMQGENVSIEIRERHTGCSRELDVGRVVNCTGPNCNIAKIKDPLIVQLRNEGYLKQDANNLGFEVNARYQVINFQGRPARNLFYIGPMLKARYREAIAVPELRAHTRHLAEILKE